LGKGEEKERGKRRKEEREKNKKPAFLFTISPSLLLI
jgi:hypothetical protein